MTVGIVIMYVLLSVAVVASIYLSFKQFKLLGG